MLIHDLIEKIFVLENHCVIASIFDLERYIYFMQLRIAQAVNSIMLYNATTFKLHPKKRTLPTGLCMKTPSP